MVIQLQCKPLIVIRFLAQHETICVAFTIIFFLLFSLNIVNNIFIVFYPLSLFLHFSLNIFKWEICSHLLANMNYLDETRVGIWGWVSFFFFKSMHIKYRHKPSNRIDQFYMKVFVKFVQQGYGGYVTAMVLGAQQQVYKCGVAVSPITDWLFYSKYIFIFTPYNGDEGNSIEF